MWPWRLAGLFLGMLGVRTPPVHNAQHLPRPAAATRAMPSCSWPVALCQALAPEVCGSLLGPGSLSLARVFEDSVKSFV